MTNDQIAALVAAAEKARATRKALIADQDSQDAVNTYDQAVEDWCELANPSPILSLVARLREAEKLLLDLGPYMDSIICYASTCNEYEANRIARDARAYMEKHDVK